MIIIRIILEWDLFAVKLIMKEMFHEVRCLKSNEDMILALAGQFKQLSHQLCDFIAQLVRALQWHRRRHGFESC